MIIINVHSPACTGGQTVWLRTNGVNTHGAAAKVTNVERLGWHFREDESRLTGVPKKFLRQEHEIRSDPIRADPICRFSDTSSPQLATLQWYELVSENLGCE